MIVPRLIALALATCAAPVAASGGPVPVSAYGTHGDAIARHRISLTSGSIDAVHAATPAPDGKMLLGVLSRQGPNADATRFSFARLGPSGALDPLFGPSGQGHFTLDINSATQFADLHSLDDDQFLFAGFTAQTTGVIGKLRSNGSYVTGFGQSGLRFLGGGLFLEGASGFLPLRLLPLASGKLLVVGYALRLDTACAAVARLTASGNLDMSFANDGTTCIAPPRTGGPAALGADAVEAPNGSVLIAGTAQRTGSAAFDMYVARLDDSGALVPSFGTHGNGFATIAFDAGGVLNDIAYAIALDAEGRIVVAGDVSTSVPNQHTDVAMARLRADGHLDPSFGVDGRFVLADHAPTTSTRTLSQVEVLGDGRVLAGGRSEGARPTSLALLLDGNGAPDTTFGSGGVFTQAGPSAADASVIRTHVLRSMIRNGEHLHFYGSATIPGADPNAPRVDVAADALFALPLFRQGFEATTTP